MKFFYFFLLLLINHLCFSQTFYGHGRVDEGGIPNYFVNEIEFLNDSIHLRKYYRIMQKDNLPEYKKFQPEIDTVRVIRNGDEYFLKKRNNNSSSWCLEFKYVLKKRKLKNYVRTCNEKWKYAFSLKRI